MTLKMSQIVNAFTWETLLWIELWVKEDSSRIYFWQINVRTNVLYVPSLCRNLVSGIFLNKARLKIVIGDDKVVISHMRSLLGRDT